MNNHYDCRIIIIHGAIHKSYCFGGWEVGVKAGVEHFDGSSDSLAPVHACLLTSTGGAAPPERAQARASDGANLSE